MDAWDSFFTAQLGASAALTGLLFVGLSINMSKILAYPWLPNRALQAFTILVSVLFASSLLLVPAQPDLLLAGELVAIGAAVCYIDSRIAHADLKRVDRQYRRPIGLEMVMVVVAGGLYVASGILWALWGSVGTYLVVPAFILIYAVALIDAWVLLVEINR